jgi:hypothetical protein
MPVHKEPNSIRVLGLVALGDFNMQQNRTVSGDSPTIAQLIVKAYNNAGRPIGMFQTIDEAERISKSSGRPGVQSQMVGSKIITGQ